VTPALTLSPPLARALAAARPRLNAEVAAARRARTGFDLDALAAALRTRVDPLASAVEAVAADRTAAVVDAAFALTVELVAHALAGARRELVDRVWREVAVPLATTVAERPAPVLAMLTNAVLTLDATPGARAEAWMTRMAALAPLLCADTMAAAGQVVAWRAGMAHYRAGALAAADELPEPLALAAVGASGRWADVRAALAADRWWTPEPRPAGTGVRVGGFSGFGGPFGSPPAVRAAADGFFVRSGERTHLLIADAWGATLHPAEAEAFDQAMTAKPSRMSASGFPDDNVDAVVSGDSIALASRYSHFVEVRPWQA
jgi:hypothetical protein